MQDINPNNQSLNSVGGLPPLPTTPTVSTTPTAGNTATDSNWPGKKKDNKLKYIFGGLLALVLVLGTAYGAFYFTSNLNQASVPTAPESEPQAAQKWVRNDNGVLVNTKFQNNDGSLNEAGKAEGLRVNGNGVIIREDTGGGSGTAATTNSCSATGATGLTVTKLSPTSVRLSWTPGVGNYTKHWVSTSSDPTGACNPLPNKTTNATCVVNENGSLVGGDSNHADIPASTTSWTVNNLVPNTTYYWRMMMWVVSGCDSASPITSFKTDPAPTATPTVACVSGVESTAKTTACTATGVTNGVMSLGFTCKNQTTKDLNTITRTTCTDLDSLKAQAELVCKQKYPCPGETACVDNTWTPNANTVCKDSSFLQKSNCNIEREAVGTKTDGTCLTCTNETWSPNANTVCNDEDFVQKSSCDATKTRNAKGTKTDGTCATNQEGDLSIEKKAYEDEEGNSAGDYELNNEMESVSKNQIFVYAFEITNDGDNKLEDIKVVDTLKGDNTDLLTYVDGDDRCTYASSTRKVTCDGMDLDGGESDTYAFRVKVSSNAINGDTIMNAGEVTYKNMPDGGEVDASSELTISTVVGCNHVCTTDDECSTGLTCDPDANKCRKPSCSEATSCNCPVERVATQAPTRRATVARVEPTELVEAGILDFPGVATFGGGLLLAVIGILLAL